MCDFVCFLFSVTTSCYATSFFLSFVVVVAVAIVVVVVVNVVGYFSFHFFILYIQTEPMQ